MSKVISMFKKFEYWQSIDEMPVYNWFKIQETNDLTWVLKEKADCKKAQLSILEYALQKMTNEYMDTFGISDQYRAILRLRGDIACLEVDFLLTQNRIHLTFLEVKKKELEMILAQASKGDFNSAKIHAEKYMGRSINMRDTSVKEFYSILREMNREAQINKA